MRRRKKKKKLGCVTSAYHKMISPVLAFFTFVEFIPFSHAALVIVTFLHLLTLHINLNAISFARKTR